MTMYKFNIPTELFEQLNSEEYSALNSLKRALMWVLLESAVKKKGGKIYVDTGDGTKIEIL